MERDVSIVEIVLIWVAALYFLARAIAVVQDDPTYLKFAGGMVVVAITSTIYWARDYLIGAIRRRK